MNNILLPRVNQHLHLYVEVRSGVQRHMGMLKNIILCFHSDWPRKNWQTITATHRVAALGPAFNNIGRFVASLELVGEDLRIFM